MKTIAKTPALAMLAIANDAMQVLNRALDEALGGPSNERYYLHGRYCNTMYAPGGAVEQFNAQAALIGVEPIVMPRKMWPTVHAETVTAMISRATAAVMADAARLAA